MLSDQLDATWIHGFLVFSLFVEDAYIVKKDNKTFRVNKKHVKLDKRCQKLEERDVVWGLTIVFLIFPVQDIFYNISKYCNIKTI